MEFWNVLPTCAALGTLALTGYCLGRRFRHRLHSSVAKRSGDEMQRAASVIRELQAISQQVRRDLASHHASVLKFRERLNELSEHREEDALKEMSVEAQRVLQPTQQLSTQIGHAYDRIRQQTQTLTSFANMRTDGPRPGKRRPSKESLDRLRICIANDKRRARSGVVSSPPHVGQHAPKTRMHAKRLIVESR